MEQPSLRTLVKQVAKETAQDWVAMKLQERDASWDRFNERQEQLKTAGPVKKLQLNAAQFLEEFGALLLPCILVFGAIAHGLYRAFFS